MLRRNRRAYVKFCKQLLRLGLIRVTDVSKSEVGMFCVSKKDGSLRLIIDARPANALMVKPPHTALCNSEILAAIESASSDLHSFSDLTAESDMPMYLGMADVDNCFQRIRISECLGQFFVLPSDFSARELCLVGTMYKG